MANIGDVREWIERAKKAGELEVVEGADTKFEIGTITQVNSKNLGPGVLFEKIKGYDPNFRVLTNMVSNIKTINLTFGLPLENSIRDTVETLRQKFPEWEKAAENFPPRVVETGPIMENIVKDDDIDLNKFPVPIWHELDGGPYIGTSDAVITRDPDTSYINVGTYRGQLLDSKSVGFYSSQGHHGRLHREKYFEKGESCPVAMVFGPDPLLFSISGNEIPDQISEFNYVGAIKGESMPVIRGRVTGLPIPANAEIAIEGFVDPKARKKEGQFGEWAGHYAGGVTDQPFLKAATLYYRNNPILCGAPPAKGMYSPHVFLRCLWRSVILYNELLKASIPGVKGVWCHPVGGPRKLQVISIEQRYDGHATQVGHVAAQTRAGAFHGRYTIVVDDDIDPYDLEDVMWATSVRSNPIESDIIKKSWTSPTDPVVRRPAESFTTSREIIYAVKPYEWRHEYPKVNVASPELRKKAFDKYKQIFKGRWQNF